jgi:predicted GTPase
MIFGINQVDIVEPMDWKDINLPSESQIRNIDIITRDRKEKIESVLKRSIDIIPFSARRRYNLAELFSHVIESCPAKRRWMFGVLKNFDEYDFIPDKEVRAKVKAIVEKQQNAVQVAHVAEVV